MASIETPFLPNTLNVALRVSYRASSCCGLVFSVHRLYQKIMERYEPEGVIISDRRWDLFLKEHRSIQIFKECSYVASCAFAMFKLLPWEFDVAPFGVSSSLFSFISAFFDLLASVRARSRISSLFDNLQQSNRDIVIQRIKINLDYKIAAVACRALASLSFTLLSVVGAATFGVIGFSSFALSMALSAYVVFLSKKNQQIIDNNYFIKELLMR